jgi:esterase
MELAFREYGEGQPMIILHGLFGQSDNWNTLAKNFGEKGFRVFAIDQRNHGLSPHSDDWSYELMAHDLKEFIDAHQIEKPILVGHSMGGKTVLFFEKSFPNVAKQLVIVDMAARQYPAHHASVLEALHAVNFEKISSRKEADAALSEHINDFGTKQFLLKNIYWKDEDSKKMAWRFNLNVISKNYDAIREAVPAFKSVIPILIISGEKSNYISEQDAEDFKNRFSESTFVTIKDAGHWVHAEKPNEFFETVLSFIKV